MATLPLQTEMSLSTSYTSEQRHRLVEFGDGYIQRTPIGIHPIRRNITVVHQNISATDANTIVSFYESRQSDGDAIDIGINELLTSAGQFYLQSFDVQMADDTKRTITANMIEVFDL